MLQVRIISEHDLGAPTESRRPHAAESQSDNTLASGDLITREEAEGRPVGRPADDSRHVRS